MKGDTIHARIMGSGFVENRGRKIWSQYILIRTLMFAFHYLLIHRGFENPKEAHVMLRQEKALFAKLPQFGTIIAIVL